MHETYLDDYEVYFEFTRHNYGDAPVKEVDHVYLFPNDINLLPLCSPKVLEDMRVECQKKLDYYFDEIYTGPEDTCDPDCVHEFNDVRLRVEYGYDPDCLRVDEITKVELEPWGIDLTDTMSLDAIADKINNSGEIDDHHYGDDTDRFE